MEIERGTKREQRRLAKAYEQLRDECGEDRRAFARRWHAIAHGWPFDELNELIRTHNEWYPVERDLPMDLRTRDYVLVNGRSYRRRELGAGWVLEQFPVSRAGIARAASWNAASSLTTGASPGAGRRCSGACAVALSGSRLVVTEAQDGAAARCRACGTRSACSRGRRR